MKLNYFKAGIIMAAIRKAYVQKMGREIPNPINVNAGLVTYVSIYRKLLKVERKGFESSEEFKVKITQVEIAALENLYVFFYGENEILKDVLGGFLKAKRTETKKKLKNAPKNFQDLLK